LVDISGTRNYNYSGNDFGNVTVRFDMTTKQGTISGRLVWNDELRKIVYKENVGHQISGNQ